jgi:hypothetical protein
MECYPLVLASSLSMQGITNLDLAIIAPFRATAIELNGHFLVEQRVVACSRPRWIFPVVMMEMLCIEVSLVFQPKKIVIKSRR